MMPRRIRRRLRSVFQRPRVERELELELQFHLDMLAAQNARAGLPPAVAERAARQRVEPDRHRQRDPAGSCSSR